MKTLMTTIFMVLLATTGFASTTYKNCNSEVFKAFNVDDNGNLVSIQKNSKSLIVIGKGSKYAAKWEHTGGGKFKATTTSGKSSFVVCKSKSDSTVFDTTDFTNKNRNVAPKELVATCKGLARTNNVDFHSVVKTLMSTPLVDGNEHTGYEVNLHIKTEGTFYGTNPKVFTCAFSNDMVLEKTMTQNPAYTLWHNLG